MLQLAKPAYYLLNSEVCQDEFLKALTTCRRFSAYHF